MATKKGDTKAKSKKQEAPAKKGSLGRALSVGILTLLILGGGYLYMNMGSIVKSTAEKIGSKTLGVNVSISKLEVSLKEKSVDVWGIHIDNPSDYKSPEAMNIGHVKIAMEAFSKELLTFKVVEVTDSNIYLEVKENGTNLSAIHKNVQANKKAPAEDRAPIKVIIDQFTLADASLHPSVMLLEGDASLVKVPDILLSDIGRRTNGVLARDAIGQIWKAVSSSALQASAQAGFLEGMSKESLEDIQGSLGLPGSFSGGGLIDRAKEGIKGLLNR